MGFFELLFIAFGLSMDAFAVSVCKGLSLKKSPHKHALITSIFFGSFQALMPLIGYMIGKQFERYIVKIDHWIAFILLAFIGINMIKGALSDSEPLDDASDPPLNLKELLTLSIATSIDALMVGVTFAFLQVNILFAISLIGITTFFLSYTGVAIGNKVGLKFKEKSEIFGGLILIFIGLKILIQHVFF